MPEPQERGQIIPAVSFRLPGPVSSPKGLEHFPTYVSVVSDGYITSLDGKLNGQPFTAQWPFPMTRPRSESEPDYLRVNFPLHSLRFYERTFGNVGPTYAINYTKREPEERDEERRKIVHRINGYNAVEGRFAFDTDEQIIVEDVERLKAIAEHLKPTIRMWHKIGQVNAVKLFNSRSAASLDSLTVPKD